MDNDLKISMDRIHESMAGLYMNFFTMGAMRTHTEEQIEPLRNVAEKMGKVIESFSNSYCFDPKFSIDRQKHENLKNVLERISNGDRMNDSFELIESIFENIYHVVNFHKKQDLVAKLDSLNGVIAETNPCRNIKIN